MVDTWTIIAGAGVGAVLLLGRKKGPADLTQAETNKILSSTPEKVIEDITDQEIQEAAPDEIFLPQEPAVPLDVMPPSPPTAVLTPDSVACIKLSPPNILHSPQYKEALKAQQEASTAFTNFANALRKEGYLRVQGGGWERAVPLTDAQKRRGLISVHAEKLDLVERRYVATSQNLAMTRKIALGIKGAELIKTLTTYRDKGWTLHRVQIETKIPDHKDFYGAIFPDQQHRASAETGVGDQPIEPAKLLQARLEAANIRAKMEHDIDIARQRAAASAVLDPFSGTTRPIAWRTNITPVMYVCPPNALISSLPTGKISTISFNEAITEIQREIFG